MSPISIISQFHNFTNSIFDFILLPLVAFNIPFNVVRMLPISWPFGQLACILVPWIQMSCVYVSTFTMTFIALHRLWTIRRRTSVAKASEGKVALIVLSIWLIALTLSIPHSVFNQVLPKIFEGRTLYRCRVKHPNVSFDFPLLMTVEVLITQYLLPLLITLIVYVKIARVIAGQGALISKLSDEKKRSQSEAKRLRIIMLALVVATFATCWAPINLYILLVDLRLVHLRTPLFIIVSGLICLMSISNAQPIILMTVSHVRNIIRLLQVSLFVG